jgi:ABC-type transport system involved in multi-copper enzyme maturation permease subunit
VEIDLFAGPLFSRESLILPRQLRHYLMRSGYVAAFFILMYTAGQVAFGWQQVRNIGDVARFGSLVFQVFSIVQLSLVLFFALLFSAGRVAQEKDGRTLILLLMTDLRDRELVLGKLSASLLVVGVLLATSIPVFVMVHMLGGVGLDQVGWSIALCAATGLAAGSWGSLVAFWRDKTFQTLAIAVLGTVLFLGCVEAVVAFSGDSSTVGYFAGLLNPFRALFDILAPLVASSVAGEVVRVSAGPSVAALVAVAVLLNVVTIARLRKWNPTPTIFDNAKTKADEKTAAKTSRPIWRNPVIWREIRTRAYGRKIFAVKLAYLAIAAAAVFWLVGAGTSDTLILGMISPAGFAFVSLSLLSLLLINAQAVTAFTSERDAQTLELLLVTDITAKEFIYGKLGGILFNTKELLLIPLALAGYFVVSGSLTMENFTYVAITFVVLVVFTSMLGLHAGLSYDNSRSSIVVSLGTMFFLFIGIFIFMMLLVEARSSFLLQFQSFIVFIGVGSIGLWAALTHKNPSPALTLASALLPFLTFYAITEFLLGGSLGVCVALSAAYAFTTAAMLIPAISDFDVAIGRTSVEQG